MNCCIENKTTLLRRMHFLMNTFCEIQAEGDDNLLAEEIIGKAFSEIRRIEGLFSCYIKDSQIYKLNQNASIRPIKVSSEVFQLIARALGISQLSNGAFDITIGAIIDLWHLAESKNTIPTKEQVKQARAKSGYRNLILDSDKQAVYFSVSGLRINLGALAKGYALDRAISILRENGIKQAQINFGGNVYVLNGQPQTIAIRNPVSPDEVITTISIANSSISTSANYERFIAIGNKRFGHLLNPLTGYPVESNILSVSVVSQDAALADALSTAMFVLGLKRGKELFASSKNVFKDGLEEVVVVSKGIFGGLNINKLRNHNKTVI